MNLDEIWYKNIPITRVIIRLDFLNSIPELNENIPVEITDIIKQSFPVPEPRTFISKELQITNDKVLEKKVDGKEWHFHTLERNASLILKADSIAIVLNHYISFVQINKVFMEVLNLFFGYYKNINSKRIGLRYINEIKLDDPDTFSWDKFININLLCSLNLVEDKKSIVRAFHNFEINSEGIFLKFQYGMHNPDYPAVIKKKIFILDYDAFFPGILKQHEIEECIERCHKLIQSQFENSITPELRNLFGIK